MTDENTYDEQETAMILANHERRKRISDHYANATPRFLAAWKQAVEHIGPEFFECHDVDNIKDATDKNQLRPIKQAIDCRLATCSVGEGVFIGVIISFFNDQWGSSICDSFGYHGVGGAANRLELDELDIVIELMNSHTGW